VHVLVTGGAGYIGCRLVPELVKAGHRVRVLDLMIWGCPAFSNEPGVAVVTEDVSCTGISVLDEIDAVIHLAGVSNDPTADYDPVHNWQVNALATERLARLAADAGVGPFFFASSCSLYDGATSSAIDAHEELPIRPRGAYSKSKAHAEQALLALASDTFHPVLLRQGTVFGSSPRMRFDLVVNAMVKDALASGIVNVHGAGNVWRPLVGVDDLSAVYLAMLRVPSSELAGETFNVLQGNYSLQQLADSVVECAAADGRSVAIEHTPTPGRARDYRCSASKLTDRLGLRPSTPPTAAIEQLMAEYGSMKAAELESSRYYNIRWLRETQQNSAVTVDGA
jgi:nucleoside-diphosphate-sugar epimerase